MNDTPQIKSIDARLDAIREAWLDAKPEHKQKWLDRIDAALDERLEAMEQRDNKHEN